MSAWGHLIKQLKPEHGYERAVVWYARNRKNRAAYKNACVAARARQTRINRSNVRNYWGQR